MARFCPLFSSSSGNATYIGTSKEGILIDAGKNCKQLCLALEAAELDPKSIKAMFITHEHSDHIAGIRVFASKFNIPVYASGGTMSVLMNKGILTEKFPHMLITDKGVDLGFCRVSRFFTSHDAKESCGYKIELPDRKIAVATDSGYISDATLETLKDCDLVLLESNYDEDMLLGGPYPLDLIYRIKSKNGHLSNTDCAETAVCLVESGVTHIVLGHLSRENNTPALVGCGSIVVLDADLRDEMRQLVAKLMSHVGHCHFVSHESMMDAVTGLSGSGPALFAMMIEALADAAVAEGLPRTLAQDLARETMDGTAHLLEVQHPAILKENVMSPGGTTAAGVLAAEKAGFRYAATEFVRAATEKSRNLK